MLEKKNYVFVLKLHRHWFEINNYTYIWRSNVESSNISTFFQTTRTFRSLLIPAMLSFCIFATINNYCFICWFFVLEKTLCEWLQRDVGKLKFSISTFSKCKSVDVKIASPFFITTFEQRQLFLIFFLHWPIVLSNVQGLRKRCWVVQMFANIRERLFEHASCSYFSFPTSHFCKPLRFVLKLWQSQVETRTLVNAKTLSWKCLEIFDMFEHPVEIFSKKGLYSENLRKICGSSINKIPLKTVYDIRIYLFLPPQYNKFQFSRTSQKMKTLFMSFKNNFCWEENVTWTIYQVLLGKWFGWRHNARSRNCWKVVMSILMPMKHQKKKKKLTCLIRMCIPKLKTWIKVCKRDHHTVESRKLKILLHEYATNCHYFKKSMYYS